MTPGNHKFSGIVTLKSYFPLWLFQGIVTRKSTDLLVTIPRKPFSVNISRKTKIFFIIIIIFLVFLYFFASAAPQRPTCSYHANPAGSPTRNDVSLQVREMPDLNPGLQVSQSGALPLSHHNPQKYFQKYFGVFIWGLGTINL